MARYSRHLALREIGVAGQARLKAAKVLVIGAGGLGSPSLLYLAAAGAGTIGIVDFDVVDISNLQRQLLFDTASVGEPKADAAARRLRALNPGIDVIAHRTERRASNVIGIFADYDVVLDGTDRFGTRYLVNDACVILGLPLVSAAIHHFEGQALTCIPGRGPCYRCLFPEPPADAPVPNCAQAGVLGVLPGVLGTIQATEAIKIITGIGEPLIGRLLTYDALEMRFDEFRFARRSLSAAVAAAASLHALSHRAQASSPRRTSKVACWRGRRRWMPPCSSSECGNGALRCCLFSSPDTCRIRRLDAISSSGQREHAMAIRIFKRFFDTTAQVLDDIKTTGFWPTTLIAPASPELPLHWHDCEVHTYVIAGSTWTLDGVTGERVAMEPGDKLVIPAGVLHAEGDTPAPVTYIVALPEPRPFGEFLTLLPPETAPTLTG